MDLLSALEVLQRASDDTLRSHAERTILTLRNIGERLQVKLLRTIDDTTFPTTPSTYLSIEPSIRSLPSSIVQSVYETHDDNVAQAPEESVPPSQAAEVVCPQQKEPPAIRKPRARKDHKPAKDVVSALSRAVKRTVPWLWLISKKDQDVLRLCKRKPSEDQRLEDIRRVEGDPKPSERDKLFRLLAIRSLALDFTAEQMRENVETKVDQLLDHIDAIDDGEETRIMNTGRKSDVSAFVRRHPKICVSEELANRAINSGIKHLVFEKALANRLQEQNPPHQGAVISAILGQSIYNFKSLSYKKMPDLLDDLFSDGSKLSLPDDTGDEKEHTVLNVIWSTNDWFEMLQAKYNDSRSKTVMPRSEEPNAKRARHNRPNCATRDTSPQSEHLDSQHGYSSSQSDIGQPFVTNQPDGETHAEESLNENNIPRRSLDQDSSQLESLDSFVDYNHKLFRDFDPVQDLALFHDFDPVQDLAFFQDFNHSGDLHASHFNIPDLSTSEVLPTTPATVSTGC